MDFTTWLASWIRRHPLKTQDVDRRDFTDAVMQRIEKAQMPRREWRLSFAWPRLMMPALAACALALLIVAVHPRFQHSNSSHLARTVHPATIQQITNELNVLASLDPTVLEALSSDEDEALLKETDEAEFLMFAEDNRTTGDDQWLEQTIQLLEQFDEDVSSDVSSEGSEEDWMNELKVLDEADLTAKL